MPDTPDVTDLDLTDAELVELMKQHGLHRRSLMKLVGVGAGVAALGGTATANEGRGTRIDEIYGATYAESDGVPYGHVDHEVGLHVHDPPGHHENFPLVDTNGDTVPGTEIEEFYFDPVGLRVRPGEIVQFNVHHHLHTITSFHPKFEGFPPRVPTSHAITSPPVSDDDSWLYRFTKKGVYDLLCLPHLGLGMVMRVVVTDDDEAPEDPYGPLPIPNAGAVLGAPELTPATIVGEGSVGWDELSL